MKKRKAARWLFPLILVLLGAAVIWFLHRFTVTDESLYYIDWTSAVRVEADGSETPFDPTAYTNQPEEEGFYRFTGTLPEGLGSGYLLFEISGEDLTLFLNGEEIYASSSASLEGAAGMSQASVMLPEGASGELVMTCAVRSQTAMFPPLLRFVPETFDYANTLSYANLYGIPAGAAAIAFLLTVFLLLLGIFRGIPDWSLIPLALAALGLMTYRLVQSCGYYFLPENAVAVLAWPGFAWLAPLALLAYLLMNRRRHFWRRLGIATAFIAGLLLVFYLISLARNGYMAIYLNAEISGLFRSGLYDGLLTWVTLWLTLISTLLAVYEAIRSFSSQQTENRSLRLRQELLLKDYRNLQQKMQDGAALRHEFRHQLTALYTLHRQGEYEKLGELLEKMKSDSSQAAAVQYSENFVVNTILRDAAARAARSGVTFSAQAPLPEKLSVPEDDLCILLMNMLDNALEASAETKDPKKRWIRFRAEVRNGYLAVRCENAFSGEFPKTKNGRPVSTKEDPASHGFGIPQMAAVAERYGSLLDIRYSSDHVFTVQTALKLPEKAG